MENICYTINLFIIYISHLPIIYHFIILSFVIQKTILNSIKLLMEQNEK